jgi:hypothetical protein
LYFLVIFIAMILQLVAAGVLLTLVGVIDAAKNEQVMDVDNSFENSLRDYIGNHPAEYELWHFLSLYPFLLTFPIWMILLGGLRFSSTSNAVVIIVLSRLLREAPVHTTLRPALLVVSTMAANQM